MKAERLQTLLQLQQEASSPYLEFLREDSMSVGLYVLSAGATDEQQPHTEDEVYVVLAGVSRFTSGGETRHVRAGDTIFVPAGEAHHFHDITDELRLIVVFSPPEYDHAPSA